MWWFLLTATCLFICYRDFSKRIVSNNSVLLLCCFLLSAVPIYDAQVYLLNAVGLLLLGILLWKFGVFGAGDIKLVCIFALLVDPDYLLLTFVIVFTLGGIEALLYILIKKLTPISIVHDGLPFAIPIVFGGMFGIGASI